ncbi:MAG: metallophosphoesterase, partial [Clostridia bacterium]|nr:metallophosphoesterase [Clostridia bacterium]
MFTLKKSPDKDFLILNLTDPQLGDSEWAEGHKNRAILEKTVRELVDRVHPDLITVSGDLAWAGHDIAYDCLADLLDAFGIPWAPVWGNHDNQNGPESVDRVAARYMARKNCIYEKGDPAIGNGNYVIRIEEEGKVVSAVIMIDSHDRAKYTDPDGNEHSFWAKLTEPQMEWYREQIAGLKKIGCPDSTVIMHIPFYAYHDAYKAAYRANDEESRKAMKLEDAVPGGECWNEGYGDSLGVMYEGIGSFGVDDGVFEVMRSLGSTKTV